MKNLIIFAAIVLTVIAFGSTIEYGGDLQLTGHEIKGLASADSPTNAAPWGQIQTYVTGTVAAAVLTPAAHASSHESGGSDQVDHDSLSGFVANEHVDHSTINIVAGTGLADAGNDAITADVTLNVGGGDGIGVAANAVTAKYDGVTIKIASGKLAAKTAAVADAGTALATGDQIRDYAVAAFVPVARTVTAGTGMTGGGALSGNITMNVIGGNGIGVAADSVTAKYDNVTIGISSGKLAAKTATPANGVSQLTTADGVYDWVTGLGYALDSAVVKTTGNQTIAGDKTFTGSTMIEDLFVVNVNVTNATRLLSHLTVSGAQTNLGYIVMAGTTAGARTIKSVGKDTTTGRSLNLSAADVTGTGDKGGAFNLSAGNGTGISGTGGNMNIKAGNGGAFGGDTIITLADGSVTDGSFIVKNAAGAVIFKITP